VEMENDFNIFRFRKVRMLVNGYSGIGIMQ
jgi:hypothetical protein